ncbi:uncharacterized protein LOC111287626 isoform X2 [Durio zibethinus]|uniref:Uncharacterized protein LOC111287626 isoform X2 n=1 Tax=Durio zibethinus TaxID=66656 RepID=A0A6P5Y0T1_DURZI|nr:uncharacterized protein LOC111287626 isoform X2 [Durio zibethinus]
MAMAIALSRSSLIPSPTKKLPHLLSPTATLSFPNKSLNTKPPVMSIFRSRFDGSAGEETEAIDEPCFDYLVEEESDEDDETESSVDLLMRFLQSMFRKVSKRAKKASRSVLPAAISPQLVSFAVDGVLLLAALSVFKALLEMNLELTSCGSCSHLAFSRWFAPLEVPCLWSSCYYV